MLQLVLIVAQSRDKDGRLSGIKLTALSDGLRRVAVEAKKMKGMDNWTSPLLCCVFGVYLTTNMRLIEEVAQYCIPRKLYFYE